MPWMGSLIEELNRREAAGRAEADRLRSRIEEFAQELARAEEQVSQLVIAREEVVLRRPHNGAMHVTDARREYLRYGQALADGWPIATGVIEPDRLSHSKGATPKAFDLSNGPWPLRSGR
jgi:hypothetical protein